jgi:DMSO/TMAO reductase YedYZ molybdopterin-dependent catalytic subunit
MSATTRPAERRGVDEREIITHARDSNGYIRASETVLSAAEGVVTPTELFFILNHYDAPQPIAPETFSLHIGGAVQKPYTLSYADFRKLPSRSLIALVECAGTSRKFLEPPTPGTQLGNGSLSCGEWTGVSLGSLIHKAEPIGDPVEVVIEGRDRGTAQPEGVESSFAKSLPWEKALAPDTMIAWALNGQPLGHLHGSPVRLVVPGWYGVWWVKWISRIAVSGERFQGFWQKRRYVYDWPDGRQEQVTVQKVKALVTDPQPDSTIAPGLHMVRGYAWSGSGAVVLVEFSFDGGHTWRATSLREPRHRWVWSRWEFEWIAEPGDYLVCARATDELGQTQPLTFEWNRLGYANNAVQRVRLQVR